jgi:hypothetical protein
MSTTPPAAPAAATPAAAPDDPAAFVVLNDPDAFEKIYADLYAKNKAVGRKPSLAELNRAAFQAYMSDFWLGYVMSDIVRNNLGLVWGSSNDRLVGRAAANRLAVSISREMLYDAAKAMPVLIRPAWLGPLQPIKTFSLIDMPVLDTFAVKPGQNDRADACAGAHRQAGGTMARDVFKDSVKKDNISLAAAKSALNKRLSAKKPDADAVADYKKKIAALEAAIEHAENRSKAVGMFVLSLYDRGMFFSLYSRSFDSSF